MSVLNEQPLQDGGAAGGNQQPSQTPGNPLEERLNQVSADVQRALGMIGSIQSDKDKAAFRAETISKDNAGQIAKIAEYLNIPLAQVQEAQRKSVLDDMVQERINNLQPQVTAPSQVQQPTGTKVELSDIDKTLDLPANDPRLTALKVVYANDPTGYAIKAGELKASLNQSSPPTPAEMPVPIQTVQQQRVPTNLALQQEYETKRDAIAKSGVAHNLRLEQQTALKLEMRAKGLNIK